MKNFATISLVVILAALSSRIAVAQTAVIEVGDAMLPATAAPGAGNPTPFTTIFFDATFASPPNVFAMTIEDGANADPCTIRIRNVTATSFDAACLEPINEDRAAGGMVFEYIAIQDGGVNVPLASGVGDVEFVSSCVSITNQQYGNNCVGCAGARSYAGVAFPPGFTSAPALLTQVQTTNNSASGDPIFIDVAVETNSLSAAGFDVALEQLEAGVGAVTNNEEICYLAVERNGCQELDFSSFGGPASMQFQAQTGANDIDGHDNGCTAGEGVDFAAGCFTDTPIAVAKQITRNGGDGGIIRRCNVTNAEIILTYDEDQVSNGERGHIDETASVLAFGSAFTTPVSFTRALIEQSDRRVQFNWATSSETFHLGFDLWGEIEGDWVKLNKKFIVGSGRDTAQTSEYSQTVRLNRAQANTVSRFAISSIDTQGENEFFGPFESGVEYGSDSYVEHVDWVAVKQEFEQSMAAKGYVYVNHRWRRASKQRKQRLENRELGIGQQTLNVEIETEGLQSLSGAAIIAAAPSLSGERLNRIAVTLNGRGVPRFIGSQDDRLNEDDTIVFYAKQPEGNDAIYLNNYTYQVKAGRSDVVEANRFDARVADDVNLDSAALTEKMITSIKQYSATLNGPDPWFDHSLLAAGAAKAQSYEFGFDDTINPQVPGELSLALYGGIDFPTGGNDHHVQVLVNNVLVHDASFDGFTAEQATVAIPANTLTQIDNVVEVRLPADTGFIADMVLIDDLTVRAQALLSGRAQIDFMADPTALGYELENVSSDSKVFAYTTEGALSVLENVTIEDGKIRFANLPPQANTQIHLAVSEPASLRTPAGISAADNTELHRAPADYLVIAHPNFIGESLEQFTVLKERQGYVVRVIDWLDIVATYGYGNHTPDALNKFLARASNEFDVANVLLVGGHSFDYRGITQNEVVNYIPSHYRPSSVLTFAPTDNPYADIDGDNRADIAIGRWPVRSLTDLTAIVKKTQDWHTNRDEQTFQDAVLIAQQPDNRKLEFADQIEGRVGFSLHALPEFDHVSLINMQEVISDNQGDGAIAVAQQQIRDAITDGADLISFAGHASPAAWGFQGIVDTSFVQSLDNAGDPLVVMPLACYTTNFESTSVNTLAHQWLFSGENGAVAVHGASVLGEYRENAIFAERFLKEAGDSETYGEALLKAKRVSGSKNSMHNNWAFLGDPALPLR